MLFDLIKVDTQVNASGAGKLDHIACVDGARQPLSGFINKVSHNSVSGMNLRTKNFSVNVEPSGRGLGSYAALCLLSVMSCLIMLVHFAHAGRALKMMSCPRQFVE